MFTPHACVMRVWVDIYLVCVTDWCVSVFVSVIDIYFYLKTADTFPNNDDVTCINFLSFIGIGSP